MSSGLKITDFLSRVRDVVTTDAGAEVFDRLVKVLSQPLDPAYKQKLKTRLHREVHNDSDRAPPNEPLNEKIKEFFSIGDVVSLLGVALLNFQSKLSKSSKGGLVDGAFKNLALAMTFLGAPLSIYGSAIGKAQEAVLDPIELGEYKLKSAKQKGFDIFKEYKPDEINQLIKSSANLTQTLDYESHVYPEIHARHLKSSSSQGNHVGGLFCGPPGTGKTAGAAPTTIS